MTRTEPVNHQEELAVQNNYPGVDVYEPMDIYKGGCGPCRLLYGHPLFSW